MRDSLLDTSALLNIMIKKGSKAPGLLRSHSVLDLTTYDMGNVVWKLAYLQKKITSDQACKILELFVSLRQNMKVLGIDKIEQEIKNFSMTIGMTFYDSAYVIVAKRAGLVLVTDDKSLARIAAKHITVVDSEDM